MKIEKPLHLIVICIIVTGLSIWNPLNFAPNQVFLAASLMVTVAVWATDAAHKSLACLFLLGSALIFGRTPAQDIFGFLWGEMNLLIIATTLLSVAMMKTGLIHTYVEKLFKRFAIKVPYLLILPYLLGLPLTLLIPHAFARVVILGTILDSLLVACNKNEEAAKSMLMFNVFVSTTIVYMLFSTGDIVLNLSILTMAGEAIAKQLTFSSWFIHMAVPVLVTAVVTLCVIALLFKKELSYFSLEMIASRENSQSSSNRQQLASFWVMLGVLVLWSTGNWHGLPAWQVAFGGLIILFALKILDKNDLSAVNVHFILFLMTVFSIGRILGQAGITAIVFDHLKNWIPQASSPLYLIVIMAVVILFHMAIGSVVATISVIMPILLPLMQEAGYTAPVIVLMIYVLINTHFLLPFHHATMLIGSGKKYYSDRVMIRYGLVMTLVTPLLIMLVYMTWWRFIG